MKQVWTVGNLAQYKIGTVKVAGGTFWTTPQAALPFAGQVFMGGQAVPGGVWELELAGDLSDEGALDDTGRGDLINPARVVSRWPQAPEDIVQRERHEILDALTKFSDEGQVLVMYRLGMSQTESRGMSLADKVLYLVHLSTKGRRDEVLKALTL